MRMFVCVLQAINGPEDESVHLFGSRDTSVHLGTRCCLWGNAHQECPCRSLVVACKQQACSTLCTEHYFHLLSSAARLWSQLYMDELTWAVSKFAVRRFMPMPSVMVSKGFFSRLPSASC